MPPPFVRVEDMNRCYEREAVITATPAPRLRQYEMMILWLRQADAGFERDDLYAVNDCLCRAQDILRTLRADRWDGATDLAYLYRELLDANLQKNRGQAAQVLTVVEELAEAWRCAAEQPVAAAGVAAVGA